MSPLTSTVEKEELRVDAERKEDERRRGLEKMKWALAKLILALSVSGISLILGVVLPFTDWLGTSPLFVLGLFLLPFGAWLLATTLMGGTRTVAWRHFHRFVNLAHYRYVPVAHSLPEERNEIMSPEGLRETTDVRQKREKEKFD